MADIGINGFLANMASGGVRPNLYQVIISFPLQIAGNGINPLEASKKLSFMCKSANLPASTLGTTIVPYMGRQVKLGGDRTFEDWSIDVAMEDYVVRNSFESWSNFMNGYAANDGETSPANYYADGVVNSLNRNGDIIKSYTMKNIFPISVGEVAMAYDNNDSIAEFPVTLAVNYFTSASSTDA